MTVRTPVSGTGKTLPYSINIKKDPLSRGVLFLFEHFYIYFIREILIFQSFSCHYRSDLSSLTGRFSIVPSW